MAWALASDKCPLATRLHQTLETRRAVLEAQSQEQGRLLVDLARRLQDKDWPTTSAGQKRQPPPTAAKKSTALAQAWLH